MSGRVGTVGVQGVNEGGAPLAGGQNVSIFMFTA